ncbi:UDP-glycosyltransferase 87A1-like [Neltuma alba]|uniref:UDP-glycosyltransferase 87A1-like n=1 Tax=Neltuma alba TaxID=207710 RepID=UPI0010A53037|nr:UDP-glycosyltransferase 87A1-like [Prosopis alba]
MFVEFPMIDGSFHSRRILQWILKASSRLPKAQYLLFSTTHELEPEAIHFSKCEFTLPIYPIGLTIPYSNLSSSSTSEKSYFQWLDKQPSCSVLYISQGSFLSISNAQIDEIAAGLRLSGGFWSHCGWNSTKEGVFSGIPFLTFPITADQHFNSKIIVEDWKAGWRVNKDFDPQRLMSRDEFAGLVQKFMDLDDEEGKEMRKRANELQSKCKLSAANGGSSETNVETFITDIIMKG